MRVGRDKMVFWALCVLEEAMAEAKQGPALAPSPALRLALAFLFSETNQSSRVAFDMFWAEALRETPPSRTAAGFGRQQHMTSCLNWISRAVGMERTVELMEAMGRARGGFLKEPRGEPEETDKGLIGSP